jgi:hypothetical protein
MLARDNLAALQMIGILSHLMDLVLFYEPLPLAKRRSVRRLEMGE